MILNFLGVEMSTSILLIAIIVLAVIAFYSGRRQSVTKAKLIGGTQKLNSLPFYHGMLAVFWCVIPCLIFVVSWVIFDGYIIQNLVISQLPETQQNLSVGELSLLVNMVNNIVAGHSENLAKIPYLIDAANYLKSIRANSQMALTVISLSLAVSGICIAWVKINPELRARNHVETIFKLLLLLCSCIAILTTVGIVASVIFESIQFFKQVPISEFLFGLHWSPQVAIRADQVGGSGSFGAVPLFVGTLLISAIAMIIAVPAGLMSAIYLSEYASKRARGIIKPLLEVLAGIPTVVYGFFAALTIAPFIRDTGDWFGDTFLFELMGMTLEVSSESALAAGLVMGVMIIPFISSLSDDVINAVPQSLRDGALGLGSTHSETIKKVVLPAALPGIVGGVLLAASRAIGETMIVVMAAGLAANLTANPLESVTTVTVQIVTLLVGDQEFDSAKTLSAFALGLMLFIVTLALNIYALSVVKKYREQYE
jgi:phosphate transport system permease protein